MLNLVHLSDENKQTAASRHIRMDIGVGLLLILSQGLPGPNIGIGFNPALSFYNK